MVASMSSIQERSSACVTLSFSAWCIQLWAAFGSMALSARRTESSLTILSNPSACAATASPRMPAICAYRLLPAKILSIKVPSTSRTPGALGLV